MKNDYPFHIDYARALTSGDIPALRKLIRRALSAKPQKEFFIGDKTGRPLTHYEELATAVWRTFEAGQVEHGLRFLAAGLPVDILLPDVDGITMDILWTPLDVTLFPSDGDQGGKLQLTRMLLAAGANPQRQVWGPAMPEHSTPSYVRTLGAARAFWEFGVSPEAFVSLNPHLRARL
jgi:hypothetical protein